MRKLVLKILGPVFEWATRPEKKAAKHNAKPEVSERKKYSRRYKEGELRALVLSLLRTDAFMTTPMIGKVGAIKNKGSLYACLNRLRRDGVIEAAKVRRKGKLSKHNAHRIVWGYRRKGGE